MIRLFSPEDVLASYILVHLNWNFKFTVVQQTNCQYNSKSETASLPLQSVCFDYLMIQRLESGDIQQSPPVLSHTFSFILCVLVYCAVSLHSYCRLFVHRYSKWLTAVTVYVHCWHTSYTSCVLVQ